MKETKKYRKRDKAIFLKEQDAQRAPIQGEKEGGKEKVKKKQRQAKFLREEDAHNGRSTKNK